MSNALMLRLVGASPLASDASSVILRRTRMLTLDTDDGGLDLLVAPPGAPPYPTLRARADVVSLEGTDVRIASLSHLLAMKRAAGRPRDRVDVEALEIARGLRQR